MIDNQCTVNIYYTFCFLYNRFFNIHETNLLNYVIQYCVPTTSYLLSTILINYLCEDNTINFYFLPTFIE